MSENTENTVDLSGPSEFGSWLRKQREARDMTPQDLSDASGVSFVQIYNIEAGRSQNPQSKTRDKLANALGIALDQEVVKKTEASATITDVGEFIDFDPHNENDYPEDAGVYVFYDVSERPVYVGQSQNIRDRIRNDHYTRFWFKAPIVQAASYVKIEDETLRKQIEKVMIKFMRSNAVINKHHVGR